MGDLEDLGDSVVEFVADTVPSMVTGKQTSNYDTAAEKREADRRKREAEARAKARQELLDAESRAYSAGGKERVERSRRHGTMTNVVAAQPALAISGKKENLGGGTAKLGA